MDSRLLNVFHDDPFDGSYINSTELWSDNSDAIGLHGLTETLHGILPIGVSTTGTDSDIYNPNTTLLIKDEYQQLDHDKDLMSSLQHKEVLFYDNYGEQHLASVGNAIEIITVDPDAMSDTDEDDVEMEEAADGDDDTDVPPNYVEFDRQSLCSDITFRTRTDSSSIGDYESHTSDYDDSDDDEDDDFVEYQPGENFQVLGDAVADNEEEAFLNAQLDDLGPGLLTADDLVFDANFKLPLESVASAKKRTFSTNTISSDVDGLGVHFDVNNFDLAEFITKDDFAIKTTPTKVGSTINQPKRIETKPQLVVAAKRRISESESDSDSDVIVDIETVEVEAEQTFLQTIKAEPTQTDLAYVDNVASDPSWSPKQTKKQTDAPAAAKEVKSRHPKTNHAPQNQSNNRNFSLVPSKKQCDFLKGKFGAGRGKAASKPHSVKATAAAASKKVPETSADKVAKPGSLTCRVGVGQSGKNLRLMLEHEEKQAEEKNEPTNAIKIIEAEVNHVEDTKPETTQEAPKAQAVTQSVKRKLNLEEYKRRRGDNGTNLTPKIEQLKTKAPENFALTTATKPNASIVKHSEAVTSIVKTLREQTNQKPVTDPITEAKNKVLRMQELKRAQQLKIIDSTISAKVPRVTKLPPLKDIVKGSYTIESEETSSKVAKTHPDYEEIIIVSVGSNTDITIPPLNVLPINTSSRSLLKSSAMLYSTKNSLIASIQDVMVKKVAKVSPPPNENGLPSNKQGDTPTPAAKTEADAAEQHGEDKIIMHLRKDRIRPSTACIETQTEPQAAFPPLARPRNYRSRPDENSLSTAESENERETTCSAVRPSRSRSRHSPISSAYRSRSRSAESGVSSSVERMRHCDNAGGYSSRSSRRHRSSISSSYSESAEQATRNRRQRRTSYKQRSKLYSRSSSSSSTESDYSTRRSSRSRSREHSRNRSPYYRRSRSRSCSRSMSRSTTCRRGYNNNNYGTVSQPAVEERRIVYVGRIEQETTKEMLRRKFLPYGNIKQITIHYKETGMKYGFVTYERSQDAFTVIDNSARDATINMYDISFGGRRAFCRASYADLDNAGINTYHSFVFPQSEPAPKEDDSFEALLLKVKAKMNASKATTNGNTTNTSKI